MKNLILTGILLVCLMPVKGSIIDMNLLTKSIEICKKITILRNQEFSVENLKEYLSLIQMKCPDVVIRQAIIESGWGKSFVFKTNNNLFGMRHPKIRKTTSQGSRHNYAVYKSWTDSVDDYLIWQNYQYVDGDYYAFLLKCHYCTNLSYIRLLKRIKITM